MYIESWYKTDINSPVRVIELPGNLFSADNQGNRIGVELVNRGAPVTISEGVTGYAIRADDQTVIINGSISGNKASIIMPASAYVVAGPIHIVIKVGRTTVGAFTGYVRRSTTNAIIDPGHVIPDLDELLAKIGACEVATSNANTAASNANSKATAANNAATSANTAASNANSKATAANNAANSANSAASAANTAASNANTKASAADSAASAANAAAASASTAADNANTKAALADEKATAANNAASAANTAAAAANEKAALADTAATNASAKAAEADAAAIVANATAAQVNEMTVAAQGLAAGASPTATISDVSGHKHILFGIPKGDKGDRGAAGKDFHIAFTFQSVAAMEVYSGDIDLYDYCMIDTGSVEDVETGRLYCYEDDDEWHYIGDLSGAQGIRGETGNGIATIVLNSDYTLTITMTDGDTYTTTSIRGQQGATGATGRGISGITLNNDYTLTITYTDGTSDTTTSVRGATGNGIANVVLNSDYTLTITMTDGNTYTTGSIRGQIGPTPNFTIGTVTTLPEGSSATATITGTAAAPVLNLGIPKGDTGAAENVYGSTIPMSSSDSTKVADAINGKVSTQQSASDAGKVLGIGNTGAVTPVPFTMDTFTGATASTNGVKGLVPAPQAGDQSKALFGDGSWKQVADPADFSGATDSTAGAHGLVPAPAAGDQNKYLKGDGSWGNVPNPQVMTGATSSTDGASGLVPAPQAGDQAKALFGDGTWKQVADPADFTGATSSTAGTHGLVPAPLAGEDGKVLYGSGDWDVAPGARIIQVTTTVTNTSGSYTATISDDRVSADMKALSLEIANPWVFNDKITVTCNTGSVTLSCDEVEGTSVVKINIIKAALNTATITSEEFDILNAGKVDKTDFYATEMQISTTDNRTVAEAISGMSSGVYVVTLDAVTNTSGSYTHTTTVSGMTGDLKAVKLECSDPTIFRAPVSIVTGADSVTLTCSNVVGSSTVKASFLSVGNGNPLSSSEYAALDTRIGQLADLDTTDKTDIVSAINENAGAIAKIGTVLWTNPSPSSDFSNGILSVPNVNKYKIILIHFLVNKSVSEEYSSTFTAYVGQKGYLTQGEYFRLFTTYTNAAQVYFEQGGKSGVGFDNQYIIPYKIIGIA